AAVRDVALRPERAGCRRRPLLRPGLAAHAAGPDAAAVRRVGRRHLMAATQFPVDNGVDVGALLGVRNALAGTPEIARFQWRSTVSWVNGSHSRSDVETFYGFGGEHQHHARFSYDVDHPLQFAAQD